MEKLGLRKERKKTTKKSIFADVWQERGAFYGENGCLRKEGKTNEHVASPLRSLHEVHVLSAIPMRMLFELAAHLHHHRRARVVHPLTQDSLLAVSPGAPHTLDVDLTKSGGVAYAVRYAWAGDCCSENPPSSAACSALRAALCGTRATRISQPVRGTSTLHVHTMPQIVRT